MYILYIIVLKIKLITNLHALSVAIHVPPQQSGERARIPYEISLVVVYVYIFIGKH